MKNYFKYTVTLLILLALAAFVPWKIMIAGRLQTALEAHGFQQVHFTLSRIGFGRTVLDNVSMGDEKILTLKNLEVDYSLLDLWRGDIHTVAVHGLSLEARQKEGQWLVTGFTKAPATSSHAALAIPVDEKDMSVIPFEAAKIEGSQLAMITPDWRVTIPLTMTWRKTPMPALSAQADGLSFARHDLQLNLGKISTNLALDKQARQWRGQWQLENAMLRQGDMQLPAMSGGGAITATADTISLTGAIQSKDAQYNVKFALTCPINRPSEAVLTILSAAAPWKSGSLAVENLRIPLGEQTALTFHLQARHISVGELMQSLTGKRVSATGVVSGTIPVILGKDGAIQVGEGGLNADGPGNITMPPEALPGDSREVAVLREVLKNFHYTGLTVSIGMDENHKPYLVLALAGNNPDAYDGRPVKLNVRLAGDVLGFLRQNMMFLKSPQTMIKQGQE